MADLPIARDPSIASTAALYLLAVVAIGLWAARRTRNERDFFIAGQRIGLWVAGLATMSAAFSGFVFLGGPGLTYRLGVGSLWIVLPVGLTGALICWVPGRRLRALAGVREIYTIPDAIACRFGSAWATALAALAVGLGSMAYLGAQLLALGVLLQATLGLRSLALGMTVGVLVLLAYGVFGGMVAGVYTDLLQGGLMIVAAVAVFGRALGAAGGWHVMTERIAASEAFGPGFLEPLGSIGVFTAFGWFFVFGVGVLGQPHMLHKFYMLQDPRKLRWMPLVIGASQALCLLIWIGIGLAVPALVAAGIDAPLERPDDAAPRFLMLHTPGPLAGLVLAGVLAAIMSTADSFMNIGAAAWVRDLPRALGRPSRRELGRARGAVVLVTVASAAFAYVYGDLIALVGTFAFGTFAAALAPVLAVGLVWRRVSARAAAASIATGLLLNLGLEFLAKQTWFATLPRPPLPAGVLPAAVALAASFVVLFAVSALGGGGAVDDDVREALEL